MQNDLAYFWRQASKAFQKQKLFDEAAKVFQLKFPDRREIDTFQKTSKILLLKSLSLEKSAQVGSHEKSSNEKHL